MRIIITFLGLQSKKTTYSFEGKKYDGEVFAEALHQFCNYDSMLVCVTPEAKNRTFPILEKLKDSRIQAVEIPNGETTEQMWETFKTITEKVNENDQVIFDITHGLRSLPFLVFLFAAYLKAAKNVNISGIYYGAWELGSSNNGIAPVIDLSEFISMIDWITATERFVEMGDGQALANLIQNSIPSHEELRDHPPSRQFRSPLEKTVQSIENISLALSITRPIETMELTTKLENILKKAAPSFAERAKPFSLLSETVVKEYGQFALEDPKDKAALAENLWLQLQIINWYLKRNQIVQAVTLAREWLVSVLVFRFDELMFDYHHGREYVENAIKNAVEKRRLSPRPITPSSCDEKFAALPQADELVRVWSQMIQLRNDIAHVGMNLSPQSAMNLKNSAVSFYPILDKLAHELLPKRTIIE